jgi:hypothetical protein
MLYVKRPPAVNAYPDIPSITVTGRNVAHAHRSAVERALLAADLIAGRAELVKPTATQAATLLKVSVPYVHAARNIAGDPDRRAAVEEGRIALYKAADGEDLADRLLRASPAERQDAARKLGADLIWETMLEPVL